MKYCFLMHILVVCALNISAQTITTIAGNGTGGYSGDGGQALQASFNGPTQMAFDKHGNLYVTEKGNHIVRKISPIGIVSTFAGNGIAGYSGDGAMADKASLDWPWGIAVDSIGNVFISDLNRNVIRKVDISGIISTYAGTGQFGFSGDGGKADTATLNYPSGIVFDKQWSLIIADGGNHRIRKINKAGFISTIAGGGPTINRADSFSAFQAFLDFPEVLAYDSTGILYFAEFGSYRIRVVSADGKINTVAGVKDVYGCDSSTTNALSEHFSYLSGLVCTKHGEIYISDNICGRLRKVNASGVISTIAGNGMFAHSGDGGRADSASIYGCGGLLLDSLNRLYVTEFNGNTIRRIDLPGLSVSTNTGSNSKLKIYPNPVADILCLELTGNSKVSSYKIIDVLGRVQLEGVIPNNKTVVDMSAIASGMYHIVLICDGQIMDAATIQKQ